MPRSAQTSVGRLTSKTNAQHASGASKDQEPGPARSCQECGGPLIQRANEKPGRFAARRFCSNRCAARVGSRVAAARPSTSGFIERNGYLMKWVPGREQPRGTSTGKDRHTGGKGMYVYVHRLVMERHLGRVLRPGETVHHVNRDRMDNRIENLRLYDSIGEHRAEEEVEQRGPKPVCPTCGNAVRRGRKFCSRRCVTR